MKSRDISLQRAAELRRYNLEYERAKQSIPKGSDASCIALYERQRDKLLQVLGGGAADWDSWEWQMKHRIHTVDLLGEILSLSDEERGIIEEISKEHRWAVTPYYLALIDPDDPADPVRLLSVPAEHELDAGGEDDPMQEEYTNPAGTITRRYPDRLIINTTNACAMFCRHCQRRRRFGETDMGMSRQQMQESVDYVRDNPEIRDVLITGGDPLTLSNDRLEEMIAQLHAMEHVEVIRIGTRTPVTMPQRIDDGFIEIVMKYAPLYMNFQFNHPKEMTPESKAACERLANAGVVLGNQMVLLEGINNDKYVVRLLNHELLKARVRPYYIFHAKQVSGTLHFGTSIDDGLAIMDHLRGYTSGLAIPTYIVNAPGGLGKIPLLPQYIMEHGEETVTLRTWEGRLVEYPNRH